VWWATQELSTLSHVTRSRAANPNVQSTILNHHCCTYLGDALPHQPPPALCVCTRDGMYNSCRRTDNCVCVPSPSSLLYTRWCTSNGRKKIGKDTTINCGRVCKAKRWECKLQIMYVW
jgi:hypothetical protein